MKEKLKIILILFVVESLCINTFAAIVSDNDGSAFITKAEFETMKNSFKQQISNYNESIDGKIDGAIASYLAGIKLDAYEDLSLDKNTNYEFPLRYETYNATQQWNNPDSSWYNLSLPKISRQFYVRQYFWGCEDYGGPAGWIINNLGNETQCVGTFEGGTSVISVPRNQWQVINTNCYTLDYRGRDGLVYVVENTGNTRTINAYAGGSGGTYNTYNIVKKGKGKQKVVYDPSYGSNVVISSQWNIRRQGSMNHFTYLNGAMCKSDFRNQAVYESTFDESTGKWNGAKPYWKRLTLQSYNGNHVNNGTGGGLKLIDEKVSLYDVRYATGTPGTLGGVKDWVNEDATIVSEVTELQNSNCNCVFARGAYMPANKSGYWYFVPKLYNSEKRKDQFTVACTNVPDLKSAWGWTLYSTTVDSYASLVPSYPLMMPTCYAGTNENFDCNDTDDFSQLPSPLVTYEDSKGKTHYMDEGMFLGNIPKTCVVEFTVKFQNDLSGGANTGVKLHISKKPFSYDFNNADLINYTANGGTSSKEQTLAFGTEYIINVPEVQKNDQLYMEWVPVTSGDLAALISFDDYHMIVED